jgi:hypothetical protein
MEFYVYRIFEGHQTLYVGKGSGRRLAIQRQRFACEGEIVEDCASEALAFEREKFWITELHPTENKIAGGSGSWVRRPKPKWRPLSDFERETREIERLGTRKYVARILLKVEHNFPHLFDAAQLAKIYTVATT